MKLDFTGHEFIPLLDIVFLCIPPSTVRLLSGLFPCSFKQHSVCIKSVACVLVLLQCFAADSHPVVLVA